MDSQEPSWRAFPAGLTVEQLLARVEAAAMRGDVVAEGNWLIHAKRRGYEYGKPRLQALVPQLENLVAQGDSDAAALLAGIFLDAASQLDRAFELFNTAAAAGVP